MRAHGRVSDHLRMPATEPLCLRIEFDPGTTPVSGRLAAGVGAPSTFSGWTELFAALQAAIAEPALTSGAAESSPEPGVI